MRTPHVCALVIATLITSACGGDAGSTSTMPTTPTTSAVNRVPVLNSLNVTPSFGVSEVTSFAYSASGSDPDGDPVSFGWDLAGTAASGASGSITFAGSGADTIRATVSDGRGGSATDTRTITLGSATGSWHGISTGLGAFTMVLTQSGASVLGTYNDASFGDGEIDPAQPGSIDASGHLEIRTKQGRFTDFTLKGDMDQSGRRITGQIFGSGFNGESFTMDKQ